LILVKVAAGPADRQAVIATSDIFRAKIVDVSASSLTVELTGNQSKISAFINLLGEDRILELVRTGVTGLERGAGCMSDSIED
ncbi:MAG: acetolactate synthase small subunit, partial [Catonella sp.]|nr:acetolactate synthase small subunit [Catonella sp.]